MYCVRTEVVAVHITHKPVSHTRDLNTTRPLVEVVTSGEQSPPRIDSNRRRVAFESQL